MPKIEMLASVTIVATTVIIMIIAGKPQILSAHGVAGHVPFDQIDCTLRLPLPKLSGLVPVTKRLNSADEKLPMTLA